ncbi:MAG TPA: ABC transporter permease [Opitutaceae bacterium]|nr:ABC transporter permease [Opitutaceae bacterium]
MHLRVAFRRLARSPGFTAVAVLMIALGIGLSTSAFSITNCLLLAPPPFPHPEQLVRVFRSSTRSKIAWLSPANFLYVRNTATSFSSVTTFVPHPRNVTEKGHAPDPEPGLFVTSNFLTTLGIEPILGRGFTPDEELPGKPTVLLLTRSYWQRRFGGDPAVIGRTLRLGFDEATVIGILPDFAGPSPWYNAAWVTQETIWDNPTRDAFWFELVARMKPGVSRARAQAELSMLAARIDHDFPKENQNDGMVLMGLAGSDIAAGQRRVYWLSSGLSTLVLLIACANLASLQIARSLGRASEFAIRTSLGARRMDLMLPLLLESSLLTAAGAACGLILGSWTNRVVSHLFWQDVPIPLDGRVLVFALAVSVLTGLIVGLAPAWLASRYSIEKALRTNSRASTGVAQHRLKHGLVIAQLASALVLISAALSLGVAVRDTIGRNLGWQPNGLFGAFVNINMDSYNDSRKKVQFLSALRDGAAKVPGVEGATLATQEPFYGYFQESQVELEGHAQEAPGAELAVQSTAVDPGYFHLLGISLRSGELFSSGTKMDDPGVVVINETAARYFWPGEDPVGKRLRLSDDGSWSRVIGVVGDVKMADGFDRPYSYFQVYRDIAQAPNIHDSLIVKSSLPPAALVAPLRKVLADIDPDLMLQAMGAVGENRELRFSQAKLTIVTLGSFAFVGLLIALLGLYGVITQLTLQRYREIGIRIALGATYAAIMQLIFSQGLRLLIWGTVLGLMGAALVTQVYHKTMPELRLPGSGFEACITVILCLAGLLACYLPARRASRIDPVVALRTE